MNRMLKGLMFLSLLGVIPVVTFAADSVDKVRAGFYRQGYNGSSWTSLGYQVDTIAELCFATSATGALTTVDCRGLAKRPEWKPIITWVLQQSQPSQNDK